MLFRSRANYTYTQDIRVQELDARGGVTGEYRETIDILFDDKGRRVEKTTYAPPSTLRRIFTAWGRFPGISSRYTRERNSRAFGTTGCCRSRCAGTRWIWSMFHITRLRSGPRRGCS